MAERLDDQQRADKPREGLDTIRASIMDYLCGEKPHPDTGKWFGEGEDAAKGRYWWRKVLREEAERCARPAGTRIPEGWKLIKDSTFDERSWKEDESHENGNYHCICFDCGRTFQGHKRRPLCKVCAEHPAVVQSAIERTVERCRHSVPKGEHCWECEERRS